MCVCALEFNIFNGFRDQEQKTFFFSAFYFKTNNQRRLSLDPEVVFFSLIGFILPAGFSHLLGKKSFDPQKVTKFCSKKTLSGNLTLPLCFCFFWLCIQKFEMHTHTHTHKKMFFFGNISAHLPTFFFSYPHYWKFLNLLFLFEIEILFLLLENKHFVKKKLKSS